MLPGLWLKAREKKKDTQLNFSRSEPVEASLLATHTGSIIFPGLPLGKKSCDNASNLRAQDPKGLVCAEDQRVWAHAQSWGGAWRVGLRVHVGNP